MQKYSLDCCKNTFHSSHFVKLSAVWFFALSSGINSTFRIPEKIIRIVQNYTREHCKILFTILENIVSLRQTTCGWSAALPSGTKKALSAKTVWMNGVTECTSKHWYFAKYISWFQKISGSWKMYNTYIAMSNINQDYHI